MNQDRHFDVAAYALGVLDERDAARFEDHLTDCPSCAMELESMLPVVDVLAEIDADSLIATEDSRRDATVLQNAIGAVNQERRRANSRRLYTLAAGVVAVAMLAVGALFAGGRWLTPTPSPEAQGLQPTGSNVLDPMPPEAPGIGGLDLKGERLSGTDPRTNVRADVALQHKDWGTQVSFAVSNIKGPRTCRLVAIRTNGVSEVLSTWTVSDKGWGTAAQPRPLLLQAVTALPRSEIAFVQVQAVDADNVTETLVRVP